MTKTIILEKENYLGFFDDCCSGKGIGFEKRKDDKHHFLGEPTEIMHLVEIEPDILFGSFTSFKGSTHYLIDYNLLYKRERKKIYENIIKTQEEYKDKIVLD